MCLEIVTHTMVCDVRPVMRHPSNPDLHVVNPFIIYGDKYCTIATSKPSESLQCPMHKCCQVTIRRFPCGCSISFPYHRYMPAKTPCAYTVNTTEVPGCGVWRTLQSLDNISSPKAQAQPAPSEELQIVRRGFEYAIGQLEGIAKAITAASNKKALKEQNLKNGAPYEKQAFEASEEEAKLGPPAMKVLKFYNVWGLMKDRFEQKEYGKSSAVEIPASTKAILGLEE